MGLAEDANKVQRIAAGSGAALRQMYTPALLQQAVPGLRIEPGSRLTRPDSPAVAAAVAALLPHVRPLIPHSRHLPFSRTAPKVTGHHARLCATVWSRAATFACTL